MRSIWEFNDDLEYLIQKFVNNVLDLVKQKGFYPYEYMSDFEKNMNKEYVHVLNVWNKFEMKAMKNERLSQFTMWRFIISQRIWNIFK